MDRFFDEKNIVKKIMPKINNTLQKAEQLKRQAQQRISSNEHGYEKEYEYEHELLEADDIQKYTNNIIQHASQLASNISHDIAPEIIYNVSNEVSSPEVLPSKPLSQEPLSQEASSEINIAMNKQNVINRKRNIQEGLAEDINTNVNTNMNENVNNIIDNDVSIEPLPGAPIPGSDFIDRSKSNVIYDEPVNLRNKYLNEVKTLQLKEKEMENKKAVDKKASTTDEILHKKQLEAFDKLLDLQVELKICGRMLTAVDKKLKSTYELKIKSLQEKINEQELRISTITNLLSGK